MKKTNNIFFKILTCLLAFTILFSFSAVVAAAEESEAENTNTNFTPENVENEEKETEENLFALLFSFVEDKAAEIFSVLTLICSLILAYAYKRGLFPLIKSTLGALSGSVNAIKENTESELEKNEALGSELKEKLCDFEKLITAAGDKLALLEEKLEKNENKQDKELKTIVSAQIDMLYDVFMSSSLPQYQKEAIGQRVVKMKEALGENEGD